jgi:hypothetical protein
MDSDEHRVSRKAAEAELIRFSRNRALKFTLVALAQVIVFAFAWSKRGVEPVAIMRGIAALAVGLAVWGTYRAFTEWARYVAMRRDFDGS